MASFNMTSLHLLIKVQVQFFQVCLNMHRINKMYTFHLICFCKIVSGCLLCDQKILNSILDFA